MANSRVRLSPGLCPSVPLLIISPWGKDGYVDHTIYEISSVGKLIEGLNGLGNMTACAARADDMKGAFDFETKGAPAERKLLLKQRP